MLNYEFIPGSGKLNIICLHNAGGDKNFFSLVSDCFKPYGNSWLIDLPGHGKSSPIQKDYTLRHIARLVADFCVGKKLQNIIVVGLNAGGNIALEIVGLGSLPLQSYILIDPVMIESQSFRDEVNFFIGKIGQEDFSLFVQDVVKTLLPEASESVVKIATNSFLTADPPSLKKLFQGLLEWKAPTYLDPAIPGFMIITDEHHCREAHVRALWPDMSIERMPNSKCWPILECPKETLKLLKSFLSCMKT